MSKQVNNVYDIEIFPKYFVLGVWNDYDNKYRHFEHGDLDKFKKYARLMEKEEALWIGHNVIRYDNPMIREWLGGASIDDLYKFSVSMIDGDRKHDYNNQYKPFKRVCDTITLANTGLKSAAIIMNWDSIMECNIGWHHPTALTRVEIDEILKYNDHDLDLTWALFNHIKDDVDVRKNLITLGIHNQAMCTTPANIFTDYIRRITNTPTNNWNTQYTSNVKLTSLCTCNNNGRSLIPSFNDAGCKYLVGKMGATELDVNKGSFKEILVNFDNGHIAKFGGGGTHSVVGSKIYNNPDKMIIHVDVSGYYPSMMKTFNFTPNHITGHMDREIDTLLNKRLLAKTQGDKAVADGYKLMLNAMYGKMRDTGNGNLKDMVNGSKITVVGQIWLFKLVDMIENYMANCKYDIIQLNTDGVYIEIDPQDLNLLRKVKNNWEISFTPNNAISLELVEYKAMYQRDVNNYFTVSPNNEVKGIGVYREKTIEMKLNEAPIIREALMDYFVNGTEPEDYFKKESLKYTDYFFQKSAKGGFTINNKHVSQSNLRFVATQSGGLIQSFDKNNNSSNFGASKYKGGIVCAPVYTISKDVYPIDKDFYINQTYRAIVSLKTGKKTLCKTTKELKEMIYLPFTTEGITQ